MGKLTTDQRTIIREYLVAQGLSFKPLQDEMADHLGCDLEVRMSEGYSFEKAWHQVTAEIGDNHFHLIQTEIMDTINKRFTWSQGFSFLALGFLLMSMLFKVLHLQFGGHVLILSFVFIAASLLTTSVSGVFLNRGKQGVARVLSLIGGVIVLLIGYAFKFLHLRLADELLMLAIFVLIISLVANAAYVYRNSAGHGNLITYLHEKYTPGIERFFLILLLPMLIYKAVLIFQGADPSLANFILLIVMFGSGLQVIAMSWRTMEKDHNKRNIYTLTATIVASLCLSLPFLGPILPLEPRIIIIVFFTISSGFLAYVMEEEPRRITSGIMVCLVPLIFIGWALIHLDIIAHSSHVIFFNFPVMLLLTGGLLLTRKHGIMRAYMLISLASYLFEYIV